MNEVINICDSYGVRLIEDVCESFGSRYKDQKLGTFGEVSTFSLYFGHHLSTIEGGMVATNNRHLYNLLMSIRSHGWSRDMEETYKQKHMDEWGVDPFNELYTFYYPGFNLRATDLQAFLGIRQLKKADKVVAIREKNFQKYVNELTNSTWKPTINDDDFVSNFCYPLICKNRRELISRLQEEGVETRPLLAGSLARQPVYKKLFGEVVMPKAEIIHEQGLYVPNNQSFVEEDIDKIVSVINKALT